MNHLQKMSTHESVNQHEEPSACIYSTIIIIMIITIIIVIAMRVIIVVISITRNLTAAKGELIALYKITRLCAN